MVWFLCFCIFYSCHWPRSCSCIVNKVARTHCKFLDEQTKKGAPSNTARRTSQPNFGLIKKHNSLLMSHQDNNSPSPKAKSKQRGRPSTITPEEVERRASAIHLGNVGKESKSVLMAFLARHFDEAVPTDWKADYQSRSTQDLRQAVRHYLQRRSSNNNPDRRPSDAHVPVPRADEQRGDSNFTDDSSSPSDDADAAAAPPSPSPARSPPPGITAQKTSPRTNHSRSDKNHTPQKRKSPDQDSSKVRDTTHHRHDKEKRAKRRSSSGRDPEFIDSSAMMWEAVGPTLEFVRDLNKLDIHDVSRLLCKLADCMGVGLSPTQVSMPSRVEKVQLALHFPGKTATLTEVLEGIDLLRPKGLIYPDKDAEILKAYCARSLMDEHDRTVPHDM